MGGAACVVVPSGFDVVAVVDGGGAGLVASGGVAVAVGAVAAVVGVGCATGLFVLVATGGVVGGLAAGAVAVVVVAGVGAAFAGLFGIPELCDGLAVLGPVGSVGFVETAFGV